MLPQKCNMSLFPCTGGPYRHEVLEKPMTNMKKAVRWTGEHGFLDVNN